MQREIEDVLSEKILFGDIKEGERVSVDVDGDGDDAKLTFSSVAMSELPDTEFSDDDQDGSAQDPNLVPGEVPSGTNVPHSTDGDTGSAGAEAPEPGHGPESGPATA